MDSVVLTRILVYAAAVLQLTSILSLGSVQRSSWATTWKLSGTETSILALECGKIGAVAKSFVPLGKQDLNSRWILIR